MRIDFFFIKRNPWFYFDFVIVGFFNVMVLIFVDTASVDGRCFIGDLILSLEEDMENREANGFSSTELNDDC